MEDIEQLRFQVNQLRLDKIIYAVEAVAINTAAIVGMFFATAYFHGALFRLSFVFCLLVGPGYTLYVGFTNHARLQKAKGLEKQIEGILQKRK